jgi:hypothetical protein
MLLLAAGATGILAVLTAATWTPPLTLLGGFVAALTSVLLVWIKYGRQTLPASAVGAVASYVAWKLPMYAMFLIRPENQWVRTARTPATLVSPPPPPTPTLPKPTRSAA